VSLACLLELLLGFFFFFSLVLLVSLQTRNFFSNLTTSERFARSTTSLSHSSEQLDAK
jgi:hypothetical protein